MKKFCILGCGFLGKIVAEGYRLGLLEGYELAGVASRTKESADSVAALCRCVSCSSTEELLALKPDIIVETASVQAVKDNAIKILESGCDFAPISIGAFADSSFYETAVKTAQEHGCRIYIASGAVGGFDVVQTISLMNQASVIKKEGSAFEAGICTHTGAAGFRNTPVWDEKLLEGHCKTQVFDGNATQAIKTFPRRVNVAVATSLVSKGPDSTGVTMYSVPGWKGDDHCITAEIDGVKASVDICSSTSAIAGWSIVAMLRNIVNPVVFY